MESGNKLPLVSVAIPLFKSRRYLDCIVDNIEALSYLNLEIILSDRHCDDDTIELLRCRFGSDSRVVFLKSQDRLDWVQHYNSLLRVASGEYFIWMPHDDVFPANYIETLVTCLEEEPDAILAYGTIEGVGLDGSSAPIFTPPPTSADDSWSPLLSLRLLTSWNPGIPFRGVFRRQSIVRSGLFIRRTHETVLADAYWVFAVSLLGRLRFVPSCSCKKRIYPTSTHGQWHYGVRHLIDSFLVLSSYVRDLSSCRRHTIHAILVILAWTLLRAFSVLEKSIYVPGPVKRAIDRQLRYVLAGLIHSRAITGYVYG